MSNYSVSVEVKVVNTDSGAVLLEGPTVWPTNDYMSMVLLQEAIHQGIIEKTVALGKAVIEAKLK
jgi:hypothetical protein